MPADRQLLLRGFCHVCVGGDLDRRTRGGSTVSAGWAWKASPSGLLVVPLVKVLSPRPLLHCRQFQCYVSRIRKSASRRESVLHVGSAHAHVYAGERSARKVSAPGLGQGLAWRPWRCFLILAFSQIGRSSLGACANVGKAAADRRTETATRYGIRVKPDLGCCTR